MATPPIWMRKEIPYLLTVLFALLGWTMTHTVDRLTAAPILSYSCDEDRTKAECVLRNVSLDKKYDNVMLLLLADGAGVTAKPTVSFEVPCADSSVAEPVVDRGKAQMTIARIDPGCVVRIQTPRAAGMRLLLLSADSAVRLESATVATWLVEHELGALGLLTLLWLLGIVLYFKLWKGDIA